MGLGFVMGVGLVAKVGRSAHCCFSVMGWASAPLFLCSKGMGSALGMGSGLVTGIGLLMGFGFVPGIGFQW